MQYLIFLSWSLMKSVDFNSKMSFLRIITSVVRGAKFGTFSGLFLVNKQNGKLIISRAVSVTFEVKVHGLPSGIYAIAPAKSYSCRVNFIGWRSCETRVDSNRRKWIISGIYFAAGRTSHDHFYPRLNTTTGMSLMVPWVIWRNILHFMELRRSMLSL